MKKLQKLIVSLVIVWLVWCSVVCAHADDGKYQSATDRIAYYHQYMQTDGKTTWKYHTNPTYWDKKLDSVYGLAISIGDGSTPNISGRGCSLLAYAHAIQWVDGKADSSRQIEILAELVRRSKNPPTAEKTYGEYVASKYGATFGSVGTSWTETKLRNVFDKDGVIVVCNKYSSGSNSGHVALAIGYRVYNGIFYVQMMDSTCRATLGRLPDKGASAMVYDFSGPANFTYSGGQYWVPLDKFSGIIKWSYSLIPKDTSGYVPDNDKIGEFSLVGEIQVVVTTRTDKGISEYKLQDEPYAAANTVRKVAPGTDLTVTGVYKNKYGNYWLRFSDGTYLCANDVVWKTQVTTPTASGLVYPKGNLTYGESFNLRGSITSKSTMTEVWAAVYKRDDNSFTPVTAYLTNVKTVDIANSALNIGSKGGIRFGNLAQGNYHFTLWVKYYTYTNAESTSDNPLWAKQHAFLVDEPFSVVKDTPVSQITISNVPSEPLLVDEYWYLKATVAPTTATNKTVKWSSSNPSVISVDQEGRLEGRADGSATITAAATDGSGVKASVTISCIEIITAESLTVNTNYVALEVGESEKITATITPANAAYGPEWWSDNEAIATVSQDGVITAVSPGSTEIRVEVESWHAEPGFLFETIWVDVTAPCQHPNKTTIEGADYNLHDYQCVDKNGHTYQFSYDWYEWCPDCQEMIGDITTGGGSAYEAHTYAEGVCTLCGAVETPFIPVERIVINNPVTELYVAAPYSLRCTVYPSNATNQEVTWSSSNDSILWITVDHAAMVERTGSVVVTVTAADGSGVSASMEIQVLPFASDIAIQPVSEMNVGESAALSAQVTPVNAYNRVISWSSSNEVVATVNPETGVVTAKAAGTVAITASVEDVWALSGTVSGVSATVTIKVSEAPEPPMPGLENVSMAAGTNLTAVPGGTVTVTISLNNPNEDLDIGAILLRYTLPAGVTIPNVEACGIAAGVDKQHSGSTLLSSLAGIKGSGKFLNITFQVAESAAFPLTVKVSPEVTILSTEEEITLPAFSILIEEGSARVPGDVNDDGKVSTADFLRLSKYLAEWPDIVINESNSDVNGDGKVSTADFLRLAKHLAEWPDIELK